ncbi:hypothetical protein Salat_0229200 [Sesamum alatum]|uniref:Uncharacterized protein n=1 Tax=Sesamum alatum TaxID=300844 RepID=A0AAE1Z079_9LAMI|nr:hypothetical protein Salat_0229200 [Sesamum alatum]
MGDEDRVLRRMNRALRLMEDEEDGGIIADGLWKADADNIGLLLVRRVLPQQTYNFEGHYVSIWSMILLVRGMEFKQLLEGRPAALFRVVNKGILPKRVDKREWEKRTDEGLGHTEHMVVQGQQQWGPLSFTETLGKAQCECIRGGLQPIDTTTLTEAVLIMIPLRFTTTGARGRQGSTKRGRRAR